MFVLTRSAFLGDLKKSFFCYEISVFISLDLLSPISCNVTGWKNLADILDRGFFGVPILAIIKNPSPEGMALGVRVNAITM